MEYEYERSKWGTPERVIVQNKIIILKVFLSTLLIPNLEDFALSHVSLDGLLEVGGPERAAHRPIPLVRQQRRLQPQRYV